MNYQKRAGMRKSRWDNRHLAYAVRSPSFKETLILPDEYDGLVGIADCLGDQGDVGTCFPTETPILMEDFSYKPIGKINIGEYVITPLGNKKRVTNKFKRIWQGNTYLIKCYGIPGSVEPTAEHPFQTAAGWKEAGQLTKEDFLAVPMLTFTEDKITYSIERNPDFLWLLGLYLAEGSPDHLRITFSLSSEEMEIAERAKSIGETIGANVTINKPIVSRPHGIRVNIFGEEWVKLFVELGGKYCNLKRINPRLMSLPPKLQLNIFDGWEIGDGYHREERNNDTVKTTSEALAWQMYHILLRNKLRGSMQREKDREGKFPVWVVDVSWNERTPSSSARGYFDEPYFYTRIRDIKKHPFMRQNLYNLAVEDDETYIVKSIAVHNCGGWAGAGVTKALIKLNDRRNILPSAGGIYVHSRELSDPPITEGEGTTALGVMKCLANVGAVTEDCAPTDKTSPFELIECAEWRDVANNYRVDNYRTVPLDPASLKAAIYGITYPQPYVMPDSSPGKCPLFLVIPLYYSIGQAEVNGGIVAMPSPGEGFYGYHAVIMRGWKKITGLDYWIIVNSWGNTGDKGIYYFPVGYPIEEAWMVTDDAPLPEPPPEPSPEPEPTPEPTPTPEPEPQPTPSTCKWGKAVAADLNIIQKLRGRQGRFYYMNPPENIL